MNGAPSQQAYKEPPKADGGLSHSRPWTDSPTSAVQPATEVHSEGTVSSELAVLDTAIDELGKAVVYLQGLIASVLQENYLNSDEPESLDVKEREPLTVLAQGIRRKTSILAQVVRHVQRMSEAVRL